MEILVFERKSQHLFALFTALAPSATILLYFMNSGS